MSLNSPAITELTVEDAPLNLLAEWLHFYFDGGPHAIGANDPVVFPAVNLAFNQSAAGQPLFKWADGADTTIRVVMLARNETLEHLDTVLDAGKLATSRVLFQFQVTSKQKTSERGQQAAQTVANLLKALLTNPDPIADLGEKGLRMLAPEPPRAVQSTDYALRLVFCGGQLLYPIRFGDQPAAVPSATSPDYRLGSLTVASSQPAALIVGEYLAPLQCWNRAVQLATARAVALAPQTAPVVLELEVNGMLTGKQLTLPVGAVNTEVNSGAATLALPVPAYATVRWKIVSAPDPADSAWRASVALQVQPVLPSDLTAYAPSVSVPATSYQPNALIAGEYLLNDYAWVKAVNLLGARAEGYAPQSAPVVLELEVNGVLTGKQLSLPVGGVNILVNSGSQPLNVPLPAGQICRWKIVSAPDPADSAWRCAVTLQVLPG